MTLALGLCLCSLLCICGNTQFSGTLLWKILSCSSYSLSPSANIQLHQDLFLAMTIPFEIFCQPYILAEVYLSIGNGIFCDCSQVWVWLFSAIKKKKKILPGKEGQLLFQILPAVQARQKIERMGMHWSSPNSSFDLWAQLAVMLKFDFCWKDPFFYPSKEKTNETEWVEELFLERFFTSDV